MKSKTRAQSRSTSSASSSSNGDSSPQSQEVSSSHEESTLHHEQDETSQIGTQKRTRGRTMCNEEFSIPDPENRLRLELNKYDQAVGESATKLASACGVVSRMGSLCPITYNDWRYCKKDMKEPILSYMKERVILTNHKEQKYMLRTIGHAWNSHKTRLRQSIYRARAKGKTKSEIQAGVPVGVDMRQWTQFVDFWLTEQGIERSNKYKTLRGSQICTHTTGSKSFARKRKEMEDAREREVGAVEFFRETHVDKNGQMKEDAWDVWEKCNALLGMVSPENNEGSYDRLHLETEVMLEVQGPEHLSRVRGAGRGPTPKTWYDSDTFASLKEAKAETLPERDFELEKREAELTAKNAALVARNAELEKGLAEQVTRNAELEKGLAEQVARNAEREKREAERDVEFEKLKQVLDAFMRR